MATLFVWILIYLFNPFVIFCLKLNDDCNSKSVKDIITELKFIVDTDIINHEWLLLNKIDDYIISKNNITCNSIKHLFSSFIANSIFTLYFKDIMNYIFKYDQLNIATTSSSEEKSLKLLINKYIEPDTKHYKLFLNDWNYLGLNDNSSNKKFTDLLVYLFGDDTWINRKYVYELIRIDTILNGENIAYNRYILLNLMEYGSGIIFYKLGLLHDIYVNDKHCIENNELLYVSIYHLAMENLQHIEISHDFDNIIINDMNQINLIMKLSKKFLKLSMEIANSWYYFIINDKLNKYFV